MLAIRSTPAGLPAACAVQPVAQANPLIKPGFTGPLTRPAGTLGSGSRTV